MRHSGLPARTTARRGWTQELSPLHLPADRSGMSLLSQLLSVRSARRTQAWTTPGTDAHDSPSRQMPPMASGRSRSRPLTHCVGI